MAVPDVFVVNIVSPVVNEIADAAFEDVDNVTLFYPLTTKSPSVALIVTRSKVVLHGHPKYL